MANNYNPSPTDQCVKTIKNLVKNHSDGVMSAYLDSMTSCNMLCTCPKGLFFDGYCLYCPGQKDVYLLARRMQAC